MNKALKFRQVILLVSTLLILIQSTVTVADESNPAPRILVSGEGSIDLAPDMAVLTLTVTRQAETARSALDDNSSAMQDVMKAMTTAGIEKRDLQTSGF